MDLSIMINDIKLNYRVGLMIIKEDSVLIEYNPSIDFVTIPGGRVKTLEDSVTAIKREINEEMHVDIKDEEIIMKAMVENFFEYDNKKYHELYILYKMVVDKEDNRFNDVVINYDSDANYYKWVNINNLEKENLLPVVLRKLNKDDSFQHLINNDLN